MGLLIPYALYPLACLLLLRRAAPGCHRNLQLPLALGLGPLGATWVLELALWTGGGPPGTLAIAWLAAPPLLVLWYEKHRGLQWRLPSAAETLLALALLIPLGATWIIAGDSIMHSWDPSCFRLVADRIAYAGVISPYELLIEPTIHELRFVHAIHGPRYPLLLAFNRLLADSNRAALDALPAVWFHWVCLLLVAAAARDAAGWRGVRTWLALCFAASALQVLFWTVAGQSASVSAFGVLATVVCASAAASKAIDRAPGLYAHWIVAGIAMGLAVGVHRTSFALGIAFVAFAVASVAAGAPRRALAGAFVAGGSASLAMFGPYQYSMWRHVGGLEVANPVSPGLVPYRESWRAAFEDNPMYQAWHQFWLPQYDALHWWAGAIAGAYALYWYACGPRANARSRSLAAAFALVSVVLAALYSDLFLLVYHAGQELVVRSTRYRSHLVPLLGFVAVWMALGRTPMQHAPPRAGAWLPLAGGGAAAAIMAAAFAACFPGRVPSSPTAAIERVQAMISAPETVRLRQRDPAVTAITAYFAAQPASPARLLLDYPPLFGHIDRPMRNMWLNPGIFPVLDARDGPAALAAAAQEKIGWHLFRVAHSGAELYSTTGLRHLFSAHASRLAVDQRSAQVFEIGAATAVDDYTPPLAQPFLLLKSGTARARGRTSLFAQPVIAVGDYELQLDFNRATPIDVWHYRDGKPWRRFRLRSFAPYAPGPQRIRFRAGGEKNEFMLNPDDASSLDVRRLRLLRRRDGVGPT